MPISCSTFEQKHFSARISASNHVTRWMHGKKWANCGEVFFIIQNMRHIQIFVKKVNLKIKTNSLNLAKPQQPTHFNLIGKII